jgi:polysaccharide pyruvyl transferase WcaK-like protein
MSTTGPRAPRLTVYGYFGMGNIGNEASLAAFLRVLRRDHPEVVVECLAADPAAVTREHGIPARQLMAYRPAPGARGLRVLVRKASSRVWDVPRTVALVRDVDVLVVPGTGPLESRLMDSPWGLPLWLFLAAAACRVRGARVALVGVGAEPAGRPLLRALFSGTVRLANRTSLRDAASREVVASWHPGRPLETCPDLAFAVPVPASRPERAGHVVIGVMAFEGPTGDPGRGPHRVRAYTDAMADVVTRLVGRGRTVRLIVGDVADLELAEEIARRVQSTGCRAGAVSVSHATTLSALMAEMSEAEVVVASRFHNVIGALKLTKPVVSLGYAGKNGRLLEAFGLGGFDQPLESFDVDLLLEQVEEVRRVHVGVEVQMKEVLRRLETEADSHLTRVVADLLGHAAGRTQVPSDATARERRRARSPRGGHHR